LWPLVVGSCPLVSGCVGEREVNAHC
jgi:hypothetical protein